MTTAISFRGAAVSEVQLQNFIKETTEEPPAMALCLKEIGYDAFVLGNHEFNYDYEGISRAYDYLEENGVPVLAANICYSEDSDDHKAGDNAFTPYITKTITVAGNEHKIGILGLENTDCVTWDISANYPGLQFYHPGNDNWEITKEADLHLKKMKEEGCEFIIVSYHAGLGSSDGAVIAGSNSDNQGLRLAEGTEGIDLLILGHDHSAGYSNTYAENRAGKQVLMVNGGGTELTKSIFRFHEDENSKLQYELTDTGNVTLRDYDNDADLEKTHGTVCPSCYRRCKPSGRHCRR